MGYAKSAGSSDAFSFIPLVIPRSAFNMGLSLYHMLWLTDVHTFDRSTWWLYLVMFPYRGVSAIDNIASAA